MVLSPPQASCDGYIALDYIAEGGMGAVYLGKKLGAGGFKKRVVLKQLLPEFTRQAEFIDLFLQEARLSATLDHANIIHTIDLVTAGDSMFIVMEYLKGADLGIILRKARQRGLRLSPAASLYIAREILSALHYAHGKLDSGGLPLGLIHRDISPSNILISGDGEVKLADFGIAKAANYDSMFCRVKGKVGYMSPEQAHSLDLDARSDLYSLAACLFEMLTGEGLLVPAGIGTSTTDLYSAPPPNISEFWEGIPNELDRLMRRALSLNPDERYQSASALQEALLRCSHRNGLMISAPELATQLKEVCGPHDCWRKTYSEISDSQETNYSPHENDNPLGFGDQSDQEKTSLTLLSNLQGITLTSVAALGEATDKDIRPPADSLGLEGARVRRGGMESARGPSYHSSPSKIAHRTTYLLVALMIAVGAAAATAVGLTGPQISNHEPSGSEANLGNGPRGK